MSALTDADKIIYDRLCECGMRRGLAIKIAEEISDELNKQNLLATNQETK